MSLLLSLGVVVLGFHHLQSLPGSWPQHYHAARFGGEHRLMCPLEIENITWIVPQHTRKTVMKDSTPQKTLHMQNLRHPDTGLYTCTNAKAQNQNYSQYLLIDAGHSALKISCTIDSYGSSVLHCSVRKPFNSPSLLRAKSNSSTVDQEWKTLKIPQNGNQLFVFEVPLPEFCASEEQVDPINVFVEVMSSDEYMSGHGSYYMRDIVVPRAPENVTVTREKIFWSSLSWTLSPSFFPLFFEVRVLYRNNSSVTTTTQEQNYSVKDVNSFAVRCRDLYEPSAWSSWTPEVKI